MNIICLDNNNYSTLSWRCLWAYEKKKETVVHSVSLENGIITISHVCLENRHICCLAKALHFFVATHSVATFLKRLSQHTLLKNRIWRNYCFSIGVPTKQKATSHCSIITSRENVNQQMLEGEAEPTSNPATGCQKCSISGQDPVPSQNHVFELQIKKPSGFCPVRDLKKKNHFVRYKWGQRKE